MGFASYKEDIERRLHEQRASFDASLKTVRRWVAQQATSNANDLKNVEAIEEKVRKSLRRIDLLVEETGTKVLAIFDEAQKRINDPNVRIIKRLDKAKSHADVLRTELADAKLNLGKCRARSASFLDEIAALKSQLAKLNKENTLLREKSAWTSEVESVRPMRKK